MHWENVHRTGNVQTGKIVNVSVIDFGYIFLFVTVPGAKEWTSSISRLGFWFLLAWYVFFVWCVWAPKRGKIRKTKELPQGLAAECFQIKRPTKEKKILVWFVFADNSKTEKIEMLKRISCNDTDFSNNIFLKNKYHWVTAQQQKTFVFVAGWLLPNIGWNLKVKNY